MFDYRTVIGAIAVIIGFASYIPYFRDLFQKKTHPHLFSWVVWTLLTGIAFSAQVFAGGGAGAWVNGATALSCFAIAVCAFFYGEKHITRLDWFCLIGAFIGIVFWRLTDNPLTAVAIVTVVDLLGFVPTYRKAYEKPYEETVSTYIVSTTKYALSLVALQSFTPTTWLFPASLVVTNGLFVIMVLSRRAKTVRS